jgi:uncharacterized membrane protein (DUF485 family)
MNLTSQRPAFEVRLLILYILCVSSFPTLIAFSIWDNCEAFVENWNWVMGWSFILLGPLLSALYLACRNFKRMPFVALITGLLVSFHVISTLLSYGFYPQFDPRMDPGTPIDLDVLYYLRAAVVVALPFIVVYLLWRFWTRLKAVFRRARTDPSTSSG